MTTKKRAKPEHLQKLTALFEQYPDGLNMKQVLTELQTSVVNAEAALNELGAVKQGAKWLLPDDDVVPVEQVAPGAKADAAVVNENFTTELSGNSGELPTTEKIQLVGNPVSEQKQNDATCPVCKVATDVAPLGLDGECQMCYEDASDKAWWDVVSDYSLIFENIMARVLSTIKAHGGATADRVRELTGMHPDDIADAVQFMVDHGQLVGRPVYTTTVYEVALEQQKEGV